MESQRAPVTKSWNRPGFAQNTARTARQAVEMLEMSLRVCILSALQHHGGPCLWYPIYDNPHESLASTDTL